MQTLLATRALPAWSLAFPARCAAWAEAQHGRFALWLPLFLTAGAIVEIAALAEPPVWLGAALVAGAFATLAACWRWRWARMGPAAALATGLGVVSAQLATWRAPPLLDVPRRAAIVTGTVQAVETLPNGVRVTLENPALRLSGATEDAPPAARRIRIRLRGTDPAEPRAGDRLRVRAMLSPPAPPSLPGGWDLRRDAFFDGMGAYGFALQQAVILAPAKPGPLERLLQHTREEIGAQVRKTLPTEQAAIAATLLTGNPSAIAAGDKAAFRDSGLAHLLAIAGLHIGIVMGLVFGSVRLGLAAWEWTALRWPTKAIAAVASVAVGGGYMLLTGAHVPIVRSFAMACLFALAVLTGRRALSLRALGLAMATVVLIEPDAALGVSFQMSFSAVLALIAGYDALRPALRRLRGDGSLIRWLGGHVAALAITSALAGTASMPYGAYHFGRVQIYYVVANMAAVPLTALWVMPLGMISLLLMPLGLAWLALLPMGWGIAAILHIGRSVAALPDAVLAVPGPSPGGLILLSLGLAWVGIWRGRVRLLGGGAILAGIASAWVARGPDILVSADARLIGVRADGVFVQEKSGASSFTRDAWLQAWVATKWAPLPEAGTAGAIDCDDRRCLVRAGGQTEWVARMAPDSEACDAVVILAAEPVRLRCPGVAVIDRFSVWREGAHAVWLDPAGPRIVTARQITGNRPWAPPPHAANAAPGLPLAPAE